MGTITVYTEHHCDHCGRKVEPASTEDGYTNCCNELICDAQPCWVWVDDFESLHFSDETNLNDFLLEVKGNRA